RSPLDPYRSFRRMKCLLAAGRDREYREVFAEMVRRYDHPGSDDVPTELAAACFLPPERTPDRDRWLKPWEKQVERNPNSAVHHLFLGHAYYRAARFAEAERTLRRAVELSNSVEFVAHLAAACQRTGKADEARKLLRLAEERYRRMVQDALDSKA